MLERCDLARESNSERKLAWVGSPVDFQREFRKRALIVRALVWHIAPNVGNFSRVWRGMQVFPLRIPTSVYTFSSCGLVAQWIERLPPEQKVVGSNPIKPTFDFLLSLLSLTSTFRISRVGDKTTHG